MSARGLLALDCPRCGAPLPALDADIAFVCAPCYTAWIVQGTRLEPITFQELATPTSAGPTVTLPAWHFPAEVHATPRSKAGPTATASALHARATELKSAYVLAASLPRADVFGDWSRHWTRLQPEWRPTDECRPLVGTTLTVEHARLIAEHALLAEIDRVHDLTDVDATIELGEATLLGIPAEITDDRLEPTIGGVPVPVSAFDDGSAILELASGVGGSELKLRRHDLRKTAHEP